FLPIVKGLDDEVVQKYNREFEETNITKADQPKFVGLHWREDQRRSYPQQSIGAHIVGMSSDDGVGQAGIEQSQNELLYGPVVKKIQERDRFGRVYDEVLSEQEPPSDVTLTIDLPVQFIAEQALEGAVERTGARSAMAVVIDNKTGEILAMANYPTFDPNKIGNTNPEFIKNGIVQNVYSPGSVFKLITYGAALEKKLITPEAEIDSGSGVIDVAGHVFRDSHAVGRVSYAKALAQSSNVCAIKTSMRVGREDFNGLVHKMGFGKPTGIELPAETGGIVRPIQRWNGDSLASMSIGYEIGVTALQMASAFATIANDGVRIEPHIIKEIRRADGTSAPIGEHPKTEIVSRETARDLKRMLTEVVISGTGKRAQLDSYSSAGKTGTAWKFDPQTKRINSSKYVSSFIGFAPANDPRVTIAVVVDEPKFGGRHGGSAAAPAFKEIADRILPELNVAPDKEIVAAVSESRDDSVPEVPSGGVTIEKSELLNRSASKIAAGTPATPPKNSSQKLKKNPPSSNETRKARENKPEGIARSATATSGVKERKSAAKKT
ncbi:MAG: peptidoglycan D,D-transpeptidase FtsI family protein, partial [Pyrinomonadaceae bacterium]